MTLLSIIAIVGLLSLSAVSAGWFDFLGFDSNYEIDAKIIDANVNITKTTITHSNSTGDSSSNIKPGYKINVTLKLDVSNADDGAKNRLNDIYTGKYAKDEGKHIYTKSARVNVTTDNDVINGIHFYGNIKSLNGNVLTIECIKKVDAENYTNITVGEFPVEGGSSLLYLLSYRDKNLTVKF